MSIAELKKAAHLRIDEIKDKAFLEELVSFLEDIEQDELTFGDLPETEKQLIVKEAKNIYESKKFQTFDDFKKENPQWYAR